ncbi:transcriptional regulator [Enterococcus cecorum]|nr:transcriptional regulator [Enterococcus cecorum]
MTSWKYLDGKDDKDMYFMIVLACFVLGAYVLQVIFTLKQMKHFNEVYQALRKKGKVAIGKRAGKIKAGTIVMFSVNPDGTIIDARKMQGVTILAKFKALPNYVGQDIHYLDKYNPVFRNENKLTQEAILNAREIYVRVEAGNYHEEKPVSPLSMLGLQYKIYKTKLQMKLKKG